VLVTSRSTPAAERAAATLRDDGLLATGLRLDQSDPRSIQRFGQEIRDRQGAVDVLVNNAVHRAGAGLQDTTADDWDATSAVNSRGLFLLTQTLATGMCERGSGTIINIGSIYGLVGPDFTIYAGTPMTSPAFYSYDKAGMVGLTRYLASALGPSGVRVNCLSPGGLRSDGQDPRFVEAYERSVPLRRMANVEDVMGTLVFLASDASSYVTGVSLPVDGGWTAK
jgi:NAD(P)-dependent dehydrogenase (short-subunit alcohol dehydrogenase family)